MATESARAERANRVRETAAGNKDVDTNLVLQTLQELEDLGFSGPKYDVEGAYGGRSRLSHCRRHST